MLQPCGHGDAPPLNVARGKPERNNPAGGAEGYEGTHTSTNTFTHWISLFCLLKQVTLTPALFDVDLLTLPLGQKQNCILKRLWITTCTSGPQFGPADSSDLDAEQTEPLVQFICGVRIICGWSIVLDQL